MTSNEFKEILLNTGISNSIQSYEDKCLEYYTNLYSEYKQCIVNVQTYQPYLDTVAEEKIKYEERRSGEAWYIDYDKEHLTKIDNAHASQLKYLLSKFTSELWAIKFGYDVTQPTYSKRNMQVKNMFEYRLGWKFSDETKAESIIKDLVQSKVNENFSKMIRAITKKIDIENVTIFDEIFFELTPMGFAGVYKVGFNDSTSGTLNLKTTEAGGYNIQCFHYRYLSKFRFNK